mmetsp:Transcript_30225/g.64025  ORF Transcript_30225/g.64025 Transcript_30225/m.64025 type:complete len:143 (+) Transcript_30225:1696-2124(+)
MNPERDNEGAEDECRPANMVRQPNLPTERPPQAPFSTTPNRANATTRSLIAWMVLARPTSTTGISSWIPSNTSSTESPSAITRDSTPPKKPMNNSPASTPSVSPKPIEHQTQRLRRVFPPPTLAPIHPCLPHRCLCPMARPR